jgi:hypothetical protein
LPTAAGPGRRILEELDLDVADIRMMVMVVLSLFAFVFLYCLGVDLPPEAC